MKLSGLSRRLLSRGATSPRLAPRVAATVVFVFSILSAGFATAQETGDPAVGERKAHTCLGCHGVEHYVNVYPSYHVPRIAGQHAPYLIEALKAYRSGARTHPTMQANAGLLTDKDIADIAAWLSSSGGEFDQGLVGSAEDKAAACAACHGETGVSPTPTWPMLAGQYKSYITQALKDYRSGARQNAVMSGFAGGLSDDDIDDLAAYFSAQQGPLRTAPTNN